MSRQLRLLLAYVLCVTPVREHNHTPSANPTEEYIVQQLLYTALQHCLYNPDSSQQQSWLRCRQTWRQHSLCWSPVCHSRTGQGEQLHRPMPGCHTQPPAACSGCCQLLALRQGSRVVEVVRVAAPGLTVSWLRLLQLFGPPILTAIIVVSILVLVSRAWDIRLVLLQVDVDFNTPAGGRLCHP
jgi:hypothetical protein